MLDGLIGPPQVAALAVLGQRGLEELYSAYNTRRLILHGGYEVGRSYYPVVATAHLGWLAGVAFLISPGAPVFYPVLVAYAALQIVRYWIIATLGRYWTHRIITVEGAPIVRRGPYRLVRHPNYLVTYAEVFLLPAAFGAWALAAIMTAIWWSVVTYKIILEDGALEKRRAIERIPIGSNRDAL